MNAKKSSAAYLFTIPAFAIGAIFGIIVIRAFALDSMEELGLRIFIEGVSHQTGTFSAGDILQSSTFIKFIGGGFFFGLVFAVASGILIFLIQQNQSPKLGSSISPPPLPLKPVSVEPPPLPSVHNSNEKGHE